MLDRQTQESGQLETRVSWLGLPRFNWSLTLFGLCIYTFVIVTYYVRIAEVGIAIATVGLVLQLGKSRIPFPVWLFGAFVLWAFVASLVSPYADIALDNVLDRLKLLSIMLIVVNVLQAVPDSRAPWRRNQCDPVAGSNSLDAVAGSLYWVGGRYRSGLHLVWIEATRSSAFLCWNSGAGNWSGNSRQRLGAIVRHRKADQRIDNCGSRHGRFRRGAL